METLYPNPHKSYFLVAFSRTLTLLCWRRICLNVSVIRQINKISIFKKSNSSWRVGSVVKGACCFSGVQFAATMLGDSHLQGI